MSVTHTLGVYGLDRAELNARIAPFGERVTAKERNGEWLLRLVADNENEAEALIAEVKEALNIYVYGVDVPDLQTRVIQLLHQKNCSLATAESCTGGLLSGCLTAVPGASAVFECGVTAYSAAIKHELIGVSADTIHRYGTIAAQTAAEMAAGVRRVGHATLGIGITGAAGPSPSEGHPAGTVFVALSDKVRVWGKQIHVDGKKLGRETVRRLAVLQALDLARRYLEAMPAVMAGGQLLEVPSEQPELPETDVKPRSWKDRVFPNPKKGRAENFRILSLWALAALFVLTAVWLLLFYTI